MARKRYKPEEIVAKLRQVDVLVSQGQNMMDAIRHILKNVRDDSGLDASLDFAAGMLTACATIIAHERGRLHAEYVLDLVAQALPEPRPQN
jgi:hypothetical protein